MNVPCWECGHVGSVHSHHVVPRSLGGTRTVDLCETCHGKVHAADLSTSALTRAALRAKRARGERAGEVPYGFTADATGRLEAHAGEQAIAAQVRALRAAGLSLRGIVAELARAGLLSRVGTPFGLTQVARIAKEAA